MITYKNQAGYKFIWPDYSDIIEVWHDKDPYDAPLLAIMTTGMQRNEGAVRKLANESAEFAKF